MDGDFLPVVEAIAVGIPIFQGDADGWWRGGVSEPEEAAAGGAADFVAGFQVMTAFDEGCP